MKKNSLLAGIAAAALTTMVANSVEAQEGFGARLLSAIGSLASGDRSVADHNGRADDHNGRGGDRHY